MISKAQIKDLKSLQIKKFRQIYNKFVAEGDKACIELLKSSKFRVIEAYILDGSLKSYFPYFKNQALLPTEINAHQMNQISGLKTASDIYLVLEQQEIDVKDHQTYFQNAIYLDGVQDPGNVGTIIRLADWFGIDSVIRSESSADFFNPKVVQATMGSLANVNLMTAELSTLVTPDSTVYGTYMDGDSAYVTRLNPLGILVMGSEGKGISPENSSLITQKLTIPGADSRIAESLNVGVAAGIICGLWKSSK